MLSRPTSLLNRQTTGRAFSEAAELHYYTEDGDRNAFGEWVDGASGSATIQASVEPASGAAASEALMREILSGSTRITEVLIYYTPVDTRIQPAGSNREASWFIRNSRRYHVKMVQSWPSRYVVYAVRDEPQPVAVADSPLERAVRAFVARGSGVDGKWIIPDDARGPSPPARLYASVKLVSSRQRGSTPSTTYADGALEVEARQRITKRTIYSVQWYRPGAADAAEDFRSWALSLDLGAMADATGFSITWPDDMDWPPFTVQDVGEVRDLDQVVSDEWEQRRALELTVDSWVEARYDLGRIDSVDISEAYDG